MILIHRAMTMSVVLGLACTFDGCSSEPAGHGGSSQGAEVGVAHSESRPPAPGPTGFDSRSAQVNGTRLHYWIGGKGSPVARTVPSPARLKGATPSQERGRRRKVWMSFPTCPLATKHAGPSPLSQGTDGVLQMERPVRVLLIEDHKPLVRALRQGLEEEGFAVDVAYDGEEGGYKAETADYDVIILDMMSVNGNGPSLVQRWCSTELTARILLLTTHGGDHVNGFDSGACDCLTKPFSLQELLQDPTE